MKIKLKKHIGKILIPVILLNNTLFISNAGTLSPDTRYETFEGDFIKVDEVLEDDNIEVDITGKTLVNLWAGFDFYQVSWIQGKIHHDITGKTVTMVNVSNKDILFELSLLDENYSRGIWVSPGERAVIDVGEHEKFRMIQGRYDRNWTQSQEDLDAFNKGVVLVEGAYPDENISYFTGVKSAGEIHGNLEIVSKNSNLDMGIEHVGSYYYFENGNKHTNPEVNSHIAMVAPNTTYSITGIHSNISFWDSNFKHLKGYAGADTFKTPYNCKYVRYAVPANGASGVRLKELHSGDMPQKTSKITIPLTEPLRSLHGGAADRIVKRNGSWYIERNIKQLTFNGSENWGINLFFTSDDYVHCVLEGVIKDKIGGRYNAITDRFPAMWGMDDNNKACTRAIFLEPDEVTTPHLIGTINLVIERVLLDELSNEGLKRYLANNPITFLYQTNSPTYEPLNIDMNIDLYEGNATIVNNSVVPIKMEVTVDRAMNRAVEFTEKAKQNPTVENISQARNWTNLLRESTKKDALQNTLNPIIDEDEFSIERKNYSTNTDIYIRPKNILSVSLDTNCVVFEDFDATEEMSMNKALNLTVSSSMPYSLNAYLESDIKNSDNSARLSNSILNIKESTQSQYKAFNNTKEKVILKDNNPGGMVLNHYIDLKLNSVNMYEMGVYKTSLKFEVEQK